MKIEEFRAQFGTSSRRGSLVDSLENYIDCLNSSFSAIRVLVFGSFISDRSEPRDVDIIVHAVALPHDACFNSLGKLSDFAPEGIDVRGTLTSTFDKAPKLAEADTMVSDFNADKKNKESGIVCDSWVEIDM